MVKKLSLSILLFLTGCGFYPVDSGFIDPEFIPYVEEYKKDKQNYLNINSIRKVSITFKTLDVGTLGVCELIGFTDILTKKNTILYRHIFIHPTHWFARLSEERKLIIYHELGHCDLDLDHTDEYSIMNEYIIPDSVYSTDPDYFLDLLFNKGK